MKPTRIIPRPEHKVVDLEPMLRDHHALLSGGMRLDSQLAGETKTCVFNSSNPPVLSSGLRKPPAQVVCLVAKLADGTGSSMSGLPVHWTWGGTATAATITIDDVVGLTAATDYDVSLWLSEG